MIWRRNTVSGSRRQRPLDKPGRCAVTIGELPLLGSNQDSPDPESGVLPVTPRGSGAEGARTPDLLGAIQALSQLSYSPVGTLNLETQPPASNPRNLAASRPPANRAGYVAWCVVASGAHLASAAARHASENTTHHPPRIIFYPMRPVSLTYTGTVGVSIQDVFDLIADASRMPEWLPNCISVIPGPTSKGKGDRHRLHFERQGRKADAVIEVIEYEPPTTFAWVEIIYRSGHETTLNPY